MFRILKNSKKSEKWNFRSLCFIQSYIDISTDSENEHTFKMVCRSMIYILYFLYFNFYDLE